MNNNSYLWASSVGEYLICPLRLWLRAKHNIRIKPTEAMRRSKFLHDLKHRINLSTNNITEEEVPKIIEDYVAFAKPHVETFKMNPQPLHALIRGEVWKDFRMKQKGIVILTELPISSRGLGVNGRLDRAELYGNHEAWVWDFKNSHNSYPYYQHQLALYSIAFEEIYHIPVRRACVEGWDGEKKEITEVKVGEEEREKAREIIREIGCLLASESPPKVEGGQFCNWCQPEIAQICPVKKGVGGEGSG